MIPLCICRHLCPVSDMGVFTRLVLCRTRVNGSRVAYHCFAGCFKGHRGNCSPGPFSCKGSWKMWLRASQPQFPVENHQGIVTTERRTTVGANQQSTAVWNLKGKPVLCDPGHAPPPLWASSLGHSEVMEKGSNIRVSATGSPTEQPRGLPPATSPGLPLSPASSSTGDAGLPATFLTPLAAE